MFETDFPHPTCIAPGPASRTGSARSVIQENLYSRAGGHSSKLLFENAARVYELASSEPATVRSRVVASGRHDLVTNGD